MLRGLAVVEKMHRSVSNLRREFPPDFAKT